MSHATTNNHHHDYHTHPHCSQAAAQTLGYLYGMQRGHICPLYSRRNVHAAIILRSKRDTPCRSSSLEDEGDSNAKTTQSSL